MANRHFQIAINGLDELREELRALPQDLADEAAVIVQAHAQAAYSEMDQKYAEHDKTGNLRRGLTVMQNYTGGRFAVRWIVRNRAPHAYWAEHGTEMRQTTTGVGRGRMKPLHIFIPIAIRKRELMVNALAGVVRRHGLRVTEAEVMSEAS